MFAFRSIEHFDVAEDVPSSLLAGLVGATANAFTFEQVEEAFCNSFVMTIAAPAYCVFDGARPQERRPTVRTKRQFATTRQWQLLPFRYRYMVEAELALLRLSLHCVIYCAELCSPCARDADAP